MARATCDCGGCRKCKHRAYMNKWYRRPGSAERVRSWAKRYRNQNIEAVREYDRKRGSRTPKDREQAHNAVRNALAKGILTRGNCERCALKPQIKGDRQIVHAHHDDYSKPLDVRWLCRACHNIEHRKFA